MKERRISVPKGQDVKNVKSEVELRVRLEKDDKLEASKKKRKEKANRKTVASSNRNYIIEELKKSKKIKGRQKKARKAYNSSSDEFERPLKKIFVVQPIPPSSEDILVDEEDSQ